MPSTYSPLLRFEEIGPGEQSGLWGDTTNKNIGELIEQAIAGVTTVSLSGGAGNYTLSALNGALDESRAAVLKFIGAPSGAKNIIIPTSTKLYVVRNECGQTIVVKTAAQIGGVTILTGEATLVFCDGTSAVAGIATAGVGPTTVANGGTGTTGFGAGGFIKSSGTTNALTAQATVALGSEVSGTLPVTNGGTGAASFTAGSLLRGNGGSSFSPLVGSGVGHLATWDGTQWVSQAPAGGGVSSFNTRTGAVTLQSADVTGALGYTPYNSTNPSGYITSSALSGYAQLSGATFTGNVVRSASGGYSALQSNAIGLGNSGSGVSSDGSTSIGFFIQGAGSIATMTSGGNFTITGATATKASGTTWANPSDIRLKDNVQNYTSGLSKIMQVQPKTWDYNGKGGTVVGIKGIGVVADEIEKVLPNTVDTYKAKLNKDDATDTDIKRFDATEITWLLVNSVKELKAELDAAKAEIAALKAK